MNSDGRDASSPFIWPPIIYLTAAILAAFLSWLAGWSWLPFAVGPLRVLGGVLCLLGGACLVLAERRFKAAGTPVPPTAPTKALVFDGIYRLTRNPMYLGMTLLLAGLGLALDQAWFAIAVPFAMLAVTKLAIEREEAYLARKFGAPYLEYKTRVRRWI